MWAKESGKYRLSIILAVQSLLGGWILAPSKLAVGAHSKT